MFLYGNGTGDVEVLILVEVVLLLLLLLLLLLSNALDPPTVAIVDSSSGVASGTGVLCYVCLVPRAIRIMWLRQVRRRA